MKTTLTVLFAILISSAQFLFSQNTIEERFESVGNEEFKEALDGGDFILLDIRSLKEYEEGHIQGAKLVETNGGDLDDVLKIMPKDYKYLVYSRLGEKSKATMQRMEELGFSYVLELDKGYKGWE